MNCLTELNLLTMANCIWYSVSLSLIVRECLVYSGCFENKFLEQVTESQAAVVGYDGVCGGGRRRRYDVEEEISKLVMCWGEEKCFILT